MSDIYIVTSEPYHDNSHLAFWGTREEVDRYCLEHAPTHDYDDTLDIHCLLSDGDIEYVTTITHVPEPYRGPIVRAVVHYNVNKPGYMHRVPTECICDTPWIKQLDADHLVRVLEVRGIQPSDQFLSCRCGTSALIEGAPDAVAHWMEDFRV